MKIGGTTAEIIAEILSHIGVPLTEDIATNLMNALYHKTENFQKFVTPYTFDIAGLCMKAGGKRFTAEPVRTQIAPQQNSQQTQQPAPVTSPPEDWLKPKIYKSSNLL